LTFSGLAGLGDLIATCSSTLSRNHYLGVELTHGRTLEDITLTMDGVAESVSTTRVAWELACEKGLEMPITEKIYRVLYEGLSPREASLVLLGAQVNHELSGRKWRFFSPAKEGVRGFVKPSIYFIRSGSDLFGTWQSYLHCSVTSTGRNILAA
jgi:hypothetical protein